MIYGFYKLACGVKFKTIGGLRLVASLIEKRRYGKKNRYFD
jgi:hypothetical protein